ncbi:MAG TPA: cytochrome P450 [Cyanobacteria bacterium UBA8156]|nr:cytochrome P450 [Cyanobacteria bacterium UBA8156]
MQSMKLPPGSFGWPVVGETLAFLRDPRFVQERQQRYGNVFKTHLIGKPTVFLFGAEANQFVLSNENKLFVVGWPPSTRALLGVNSLALQTGSTHTQRRKLLAQAFQPRALAGYLPTMLAIAEEYCQRWCAQGAFAWYPELRQYTFDVAGALLVGTDRAATGELGHLFETWSGGLFALPFNLPWTAFGQALRARDRLLQYIETMVQQRRSTPNPGTDALGILVSATDEDGQQLSITELNEQVQLLLFAGHETLTSAIAGFCLLLAQHPAVKAKARAEQQAIGGDITPETLKEMAYLEAVIQETLRCIPPVGGGFRETLADCTWQDYTIPKGWTVLYHIATTHTLPDLYPHPGAFDPDRFLVEKRPKPFGYVPFGGGLRECLGKEFARLEMKAFGAHLLRHYEWELPPDGDSTLILNPTPHPKDNLRIHFSRLISQT